MKMTERECALLAFQHQDTPWVPSPTTSMDVCIPSVIEEGARGYGITTDWFGVKYLYREDQPGPMPVESDTLIDNMENWKDVVKFPDLDAYDWGKNAETDTAHWDRSNKVSKCILINGCFESLHMFCGFVEALCNIQEYEEECTDFMAAIADYKIQLIERIAKYYKPDVIQFHDDYANNLNMFMPLEKWRRMIRPNLQRIVDATKGNHMIYLHHSDGIIKDMIPDFVDMGIEALNPVQVENDPLAVKKKYGNVLTINGGFDNVKVLDNPDATESQIRDSINETLYQLAPGGQWIAHCSFLNRFSDRNHIWIECLDEYNRPLMEKAGVKFVPHKDAKVLQSVYDVGSKNK